MNYRIERTYEALDEMAHAISENQIPTMVRHEDPNRPGEHCVWPETFLAWKQKVMKAEQTFGRKCLTALQWGSLELYMRNQYHFAEISLTERERWL